MSMGTSSSEVVEVVSSESGMSNTSSSEEDDEKDGDADRGMELLEGEALNREMLKPSVWKIEAKEGLLGGTVTEEVRGVSGRGAGGAYGGGGGEAGGGDGGGGGGRAPSCCSV